MDNRCVNKQPVEGCCSEMIIRHVTCCHVDVFQNMWWLMMTCFRTCGGLMLMCFSTCGGGNCRGAWLWWQRPLLSLESSHFRWYVHSQTIPSYSHTPYGTCHTYPLLLWYIHMCMSVFVSILFASTCKEHEITIQYSNWTCKRTWHD